MTRWEKGTVALVALGLAIMAPAWAAPVGSLGEIRESHARIHDVVIEAERTDLHERELKQMEGNAGSFLQFARVRLYYMAPDRLRMEGRRGLIPVTVVVNGNIQVVRFGLGIKNRRDLSDAIRRKPTGLEFGLLSGDIWQDYNVTEIGSEDWESRPAILLHLQVRGERPDSSFQKVWVDRETHRVLRRDRFTGDGKLRSRELFRDPYQSPAGTWLSRRIEVYNQLGRFVGAMVLKTITVNRGLAEALFRT